MILMIGIGTAFGGGLASYLTPVEVFLIGFVLGIIGLTFYLVAVAYGQPQPTVGGQPRKK